MGEIGRTARDNDTQLLIFTIPERGVVNPDNPHNYRPEVGQSYCDAQRHMLQRIAGYGSNVRTMDLTTALREESARSDRRVYGEIDGRITDYGLR